MALNGLVHPFPVKCESLNWRWVVGNQMTPQGLGPKMNQQVQCNYGDSAPYQDPRVLQQLENTLPFRVWGYPAVTQCGRMAPLLYYHRRDPNPDTRSCGASGVCGGQPSGKCSCGSDNPSWPYTRR